MPSSPTAHAAVKQPSRLKRIFWYMAPIQSSVVIMATNDVLVAESYPSPRVSTAGHIFYALLWTAAVAAYSVFVTYQHFTLPDAEYFMHEPASDQPMPEVTVEAWCSRVGQCGDFTIIADYTGGPSWCQGQRSPQFNQTWGAFTEMKGRSWKFPLCYSGESIYSTYNDLHMPGRLGLVIDFQSINVSPNLRPDPSVNTPVPYVYPPFAAAAAALVEGEKSEQQHRDFDAQDHHAKSSTSTAVVRLTGPGGLNRTINLEAWQVKTVVMGQSVTYKDLSYVGATVFPLAVQYEGRRPSLRATAVVSMAEYADVTRVMTKKGDTTFRGILSLLGVMCGMAFMMNSCQIFIEPVIVAVFPGPAEIARREAVKKAKEVEAEAAGNGGGVDAKLLDGADDEELAPVAASPKQAAPLPPNPTRSAERGGDMDEPTTPHSPMTSAPGGSTTTINAAQSTTRLPPLVDGEEEDHATSSSGRSSGRGAPYAASAAAPVAARARAPSAAERSTL